MTVLRSEMLRRLAQSEFDVLVIGGGITGAGIAQDAAHRGLRTALVEKGDFACGTTRASTKLLHGGLRYLEQFAIKLMYEALHERNRLTRLAPHVAEWLAFLIPIYGNGWKMERIGYGLWLYDLLAGWPRGRLHRRVGREEALRQAPDLKPDGLRGAYLYYDCRTDDTRLTLDVIASAIAGGAAVANYCQVIGLDKRAGRVAGALVRDNLTGEAFTLRAGCTVNAAGVWADQIGEMDTPGVRHHLRPSKGAHVLVPADRLPVQAAVLAPSPAGDGRFIFVVPWQGAVLLGTTDTPYDDDPDRVAPDGDDVAYILAAANATFPGAGLTAGDVISSFAGLRPLIATQAGSTAQLSREHKIWVTDSGLVSIAGGKLTTYRTMGRQVVDLVLRRLGRPRLPCRTGDLPLGQERAAGLAALSARHPDLAAPLLPDLPVTRAEVAYAAQAELAVTPDDFLQRRSRIALLDRGHGEAQRGQVAELLRRFGAPAPTGARPGAD